MAALHVGSERLLAGFDALSGVSHARALEESADFMSFNVATTLGMNLAFKHVCV